MNFKSYSHLEGQHAFLSPSKYHWIRYDLEKLESSYNKRKAKEMGTRLHTFADECISLGVRLPDEPLTLNLYVNDALYYDMDSEVMLYYSDNCFGTADAISFDIEENLLRIHDLKTGTSRVSMDQLEVYTALFCLSYDVHPNNIDIELRIYKENEVLVHDPDKVDIINIMEKIITFDRIIEEMESEGNYVG